MSLVGLAHFIELVVLFIIGIQVFRYLFRKWGISPLVFYIRTNAYKVYY